MRPYILKIDEHEATNLRYSASVRIRYDNEEGTRSDVGKSGTWIIACFRKLPLAFKCQISYGNLIVSDAMHVLYFVDESCETMKRSYHLNPAATPAILPTTGVRIRYDDTQSPRSDLGQSGTMVRFVEGGKPRLCVCRRKSRMLWVKRPWKLWQSTNISFC